MKQRITLEIELTDPVGTDGMWPLERWLWADILKDLSVDSVAVVPSDPFANAWWVVAATMKWEGREDEYYVYAPEEGAKALDQYLKFLDKPNIVTACLGRIVLSTDHEGAGRDYVDRTIKHMVDVRPELNGASADTLNVLRREEDVREVADEAPRTYVRRVRKKEGMESRDGGKTWSTSIPHATLIRAVLDGKVVQAKNSELASFPWEEFDDATVALAALVNRTDLEFRLKPEPVVQFCPIYAPKEGENGLYIAGSYNKHEYAVSTAHNDALPVKVMRVELNPDDLSVISATTEDV